MVETEGNGTHSFASRPRTCSGLQPSLRSAPSSSTSRDPSVRTRNLALADALRERAEAWAERTEYLPEQSDLAAHGQMVAPHVEGGLARGYPRAQVRGERDALVSAKVSVRHPGSG